MKKVVSYRLGINIDNLLGRTRRHLRTRNLVRPHKNKLFIISARIWILSCIKKFFYSKNVLSNSADLSSLMPVIACGAAPRPMTRTTTPLTQVFQTYSSSSIHSSYMFLCFLFGYSILLLDPQARHFGLEISETKIKKFKKLGHPHPTFQTKRMITILFCYGA